MLTQEANAARLLEKSTSQLRKSTWCRISLSFSPLSQSTDGLEIPLVHLFDAVSLEKKLLPLRVAWSTVNNSTRQCWNLQNIANCPRKSPSKEIICGLEPNIGVPEYIQSQPRIDLSPIIQAAPEQSLSLDMSDDTPNNQPIMGQLDTSQRAANCSPKASQLPKTLPAKRKRADSDAISIPVRPTSPDDFLCSWDSRREFQSDGLPAKDSVKLDPIKPLLQVGDAHFEAWHDKIMKALQDNNLQKLVEINRLRPERIVNGTPDWYQMSRIVQTWIGQCMEQELLEMMRRRSGEWDFADVFMYETRTAFRDEAVIVQFTTYNTLMELRRVDYSSTRSYIKQVIKLYKQTEDHGIKVDLYGLLARIASQLEMMPNLKSTVQELKMRLFEDFRPNLAGTMTRSEFCQVMNKWVIRLHYLED